VSSAIRILGIDPGLRFMGWGVIESEGSSLRHIANGAVTSDGTLCLAERLVQIHQGLVDVVRAYEPDEAAVEQTFVNRDGAATLKLGQARGIALLVPAQAGLLVAEYAPNKVKKSVVGAGHADKKQILTMVSMLLPSSDIKSPDAADALAIAICHAHHRTADDKISAALLKEIAK
jgi:crossover junction endodeoxyribonuclease RuvC